MRRAARTDSNHQEIIDGLRQIGVTVFDTSMIPKFVDSVAGWRGENYMFEFKDGDKPPSKRKLTAAQQELHESWRGTIYIIESLQDALEVLGIVSYRPK
jgi:hypothetical protein